MTIFQFLIQLTQGQAMTDLVLLLENAKIKSPDMAPAIQKWIDALNAVPSQANLIALATAILAEAGDISKGKLDGRDHPSDVI